MNRVAIVLLVVICATTGCASQARYVEQGADTGVIAIPANTDAFPTYNRRTALALIEKHVGPNYEIIDQREVATGTATTNNQNVNNEQTWNTSSPFLPANKQTISTTTTTHDLTEWRIAYRKKNPTALPASSANSLGVANGTPGVSPAGGVAAPGTGAQPAGGIIPSAGPNNGVVPAGGAARNQSSGPYVNTSAFIGQMR